MLLVPYWPNPFVLFIWLGLVLGPAVGIITAFPAAVLQPENRAAGMGLYYSFYYGALSALMTVTGFSRDFTQSPAAPLLFGGMLIFLAIIILGLFRMLQARAKLLPLASAIK